jgi:adenine-specific DNA-methyltransferase
LNKIPLTEKAKKEYSYKDEKGSFRRAILLDKTRGRHYYDVTTKNGLTLNGPWMIKEDEFKEKDKNNEILWTNSGDEQPYGKIYLHLSKGQIANDFWDTSYGSNQEASLKLESLFENRVFDFPKSVKLLSNIILIGGDKKAIILDYFAGSGTTGHAVINLNRIDEGKRKYILVEMGAYFNTVTKPRIQKVIYSDNWKEGKPQDKKGISQMFKYMVLESYEDALNNLTLQQTPTQQGALALNDKVKEEYLLQYMLDVESQDHLFNLNAFKNPFAYQLNVTENNELVPTTVDLVETFNYLIGLKVQKVERIKDFKLVTGINLKGDKILVIWRNLEKTNNDDLNRFVEKLDIKVFDGEFDIIYVNGDNNLANFKKEEETWKVRLIEEEFFNKMFDVKDI